MKYLVKLFSLLVKSDKINVPELLVVLLKVKCERVYILCLYFVYFVSSYFNFFHHPIISDVGRIAMNVKMSARADSLDSSLQCQRFESNHQSNRGIFSTINQKQQ